MTTPAALDDALTRILSVRGRYAGLRPANRPDYPTLYDWRSQLAESHLWATVFRRIVRFDEFVQEMEVWFRDAIVMMIVDLESGAPIGFARAYYLNVVDGWAYTQGFAVEPFRLRRHVAEASVMFSTYLFEHFPLRKICSEVFEYNESVVRIHRKAGFKEAGRLRRHIWFKDRYWDLLQFEMFREDWDAAMKRFQFLTTVEVDLERQIEANGR